MSSKYPVLSRISVIFLDNVVTILSFFLSIYIRNISLRMYEFGAEIEWDQHLIILLLIVIIWRGLSGYQEAYVGSRYSQLFTSLRTDLLIAFRTVVVGSLILLSIVFFMKSNVARTLILFFAVINLILLSLEKILLYQFIAYLRKKGRAIKNILILGTGDVAAQFIESIKKYPDWGVRVLGMIGKDDADIGKYELGYEIVGSSGSLATTLHSHHIDELVVALPAKYLANIEAVMSLCDKEGVPVSVISPFFKNLVSKARTEDIHGMPVIKFLPVVRNDLELALKRTLDVVIAFIGLIILAPLFIVIAVMIKIDSPGPVFYRWKVLGLHKKPLTSYKFRTMVQKADELKAALMAQNEMSGAVFKMENDPRVTSVGRWLRKYSLDELPQLWSVLKGDLSLVGPRPPLQTEVEKFEGWHRRKLSVKPGITCLWQTGGRNEIRDFNEWMRLDLKYIDEWSFWLDLKILLKTVAVVFKGTGR